MSDHTIVIIWVMKIFFVFLCYWLLSFYLSPSLFSKFQMHVLIKKIRCSRFNPWLPWKCLYMLLPYSYSLEYAKPFLIPRIFMCILLLERPPVKSLPGHALLSCRFSCRKTLLTIQHKSGPSCLFRSPFSTHTVYHYLSLYIYLCVVKLSWSLCLFGM